MQKSLVRKGLVLGIIVLFVGTSIPLQGATIGPKNIKNVQIHESLVPPDVKAGDIVFFEVYNYSHYNPGWDHVGLYIGNNEFIHASQYLHCVAKQNISIFEPLDMEIVYGKVITSNETQRTNAINFAEGQIGKPFYVRDPKDPSFDSEAWYCSELVWAAYLSQGIDIDKNGWSFPPFVGTSEMCWDDDVEMYSYHKLNKWIPGFYISWLINYLINWPKNHKS